MYTESSSIANHKEAAMSQEQEVPQANPLDMLMRRVERGQGISLNPGQAQALASAVLSFVNKFAMAQHRLDISNRLTTALVAILDRAPLDLDVEGDDEGVVVEMSNELFERVQEEHDGFWVYYRPSTNSILVGLGSLPEELIEDSEEVVADVLPAEEE
jgi:hypothetical protein